MGWMTMHSLAALLVLHAAMVGQAADAPSAAEYWAQTLPGFALPAVLRQRVPAPMQELHHKSVMQAHEIASAGRPSTTSLCAAGHRYFNARQFDSFRKPPGSRGVTIRFRRVDPASMASMSKGNFFKESTLVAGTHMVFADQLDRTPKAAFLPRQLVDVLQPASVELFQIAFGVPPGSLLAEESMHTSKICQKEEQSGNLLKGEQAGCAMCLEDLADQVHARFNGSKAELLPVSVPSAAGGKLLTSIKAKLVEVELRAEANEPYLVCHTQTYPFAVYYCHYIPNTRVYGATLQTEVGSELFHGVAICHTDTSGWDAKHVAFSDLHSSAGRTEACHWTHEGGLVFVPAVNN